jgi:hypothetical protein
LIGKPDGKRPLGRTRFRWGNNFRMEIGSKVVDWMHMAEDRGQ